MAFDALPIMSMVEGIFYHSRMVMLVALMNVVVLAAPQAQPKAVLRDLLPQLVPKAG